MDNRSPVQSVDAALGRIGAFKGHPSKFLLAVHESLLDPFGMNMALITDAVLARGWEPDGFIEEQGYRSYKYKELS